MNKKEKEILNKEYEKMRKEISHKYWYEYYAEALRDWINIANDTIKYYEKEKGEK